MRKFKRILISGGLSASLATGATLMFLQPVITTPQTEVNLSFTKNEIQMNYDSAETSQGVFNASEDAGMIDAASTEQAIKNYQLQNGMIRFINGEGNRIQLVEVITQIYGYGYESTNDQSSNNANNIGDSKTLADFPQFENLLTGVYFIDWVSQGLRTGLTQTFINKRTSELVTELTTIQSLIGNTHPLSNVVDILLNANSQSPSLKITNANQIVKALLNDATVNNGFDATKTEWGALGYNFYPLSANQKGIFQTLAKYNVKAMLNSVAIDTSLKKGAVESSELYYQDPAKGELERMGVDWILVQFGPWRDIFLNNKRSALYNPNEILNAFGVSERISEQLPWEDFDPDHKLNKIVPQGYLNDARIKTEIVPFFSKLHYAILEQGTRLAPYDVDNEPNIDINYGHNYGLTPKQYATLGKGVQQTLREMTVGKSFRLSDASENNGAPTGQATNNPEEIIYTEGIDLPISLNSHSRLGADDTFGLWNAENNPNNENNVIKYDLKAYVSEVLKYWPEARQNAILSYHTYWDFNPQVISDVYDFATKDVATKMTNKTFDPRQGVVPTGQANSGIPEHMTIITELSYNFWPDAKLDNDDMGGSGSHNNSWFMAMGFTYQMHYHAQLAGAVAFMPYHGMETVLSSWKDQSNGEKYLTEQRKYAHDLNNNIVNYPENTKNQAAGLTGKQPAYIAGVAPSLHVYNMLNEGDRYLRTISKAIEATDSSLFGDVWYEKSTADQGKLKLFLVNDSENEKTINLSLDEYQEIAIANGETDSAFHNSGPMEHLSIRGGISNRPYIGQQTENGLDGIVYLHLSSNNPGQASRLQINNNQLRINLPAWSLYSVELDVTS